MTRRIGALLLTSFLFAASPATAQPLTFDHGAVAGPTSNARGELFVPAGQGPFPAIVVLHGCDGVGPHYRIWARRLASWAT